MHVERALWKYPDSEEFGRIVQLYVELEAVQDRIVAADQEMGSFVQENWLQELGALIANARRPATVGDIAAWPEASHGIRLEGLLLLIERDASEHYDQVEGFCDNLIGLEREPHFDRLPRDANGMGLCQYLEHLLGEP